MSDAPTQVLILALRAVDVDGVRHEEGAEVPIRAELLQDLVRCGAVMELPWPLLTQGTKSEGEGSAGGAPGGPTPQPALSGTIEPDTQTAANAGDDSPSAEVGGDGDRAAGAGPDGMPGQTGADAEHQNGSADPPDGTSAAPAAATASEPITQAEEGAVSSKGRAATPGDGAADGGEPADAQEAAEAAGASTETKKRRGRG